MKQEFNIPTGATKFTGEIIEGKVVIQFEPEKIEWKDGMWGWNETIKKALRITDKPKKPLSHALDDIQYTCCKEWAEYYCKRQATTSEIEATLKKVAEAKGSKEGVTCNGVTYSGYLSKGTRHLLKHSTFYIPKIEEDGIIMFCCGLRENNGGNPFIYNNTTDTWAEIIKEPVTLTSEQIEAVCEWLYTIDNGWAAGNFRTKFAQKGGNQ